MYKQVTLALAGLVAMSSATHVSHEMNPFHLMNFVQAATPANVFNSIVKDLQGKNLKDGHVVFAPCGSDVKGLFILD